MNHHSAHVLIWLAPALDRFFIEGMPPSGWNHMNSMNIGVVNSPGSSCVSSSWMKRCEEIHQLINAVRLDDVAVGQGSRMSLIRLQSQVREQCRILPARKPRHCFWERIRNDDFDERTRRE